MQERVTLLVSPILLRSTSTMLKFIDEVLSSFRPCFSRKAAYEWFVVIVIGLMVRADHLGITEVYTNRQKGCGEVNGKDIAEYTCDINEMTSVTIRGEMVSYAIAMAGKGKVIASCTYDDNGEILKSEGDEWGDRAGFNSFIYDLYLPASHIWEKCSITIAFDANSTSGCMVTLLKNGELAYLPDGTLPGWVESTGSDTMTYTFDIGAQVPLVVVGYVSNKLIGGGANITLLGYYRGRTI